MSRRNDGGLLDEVFEFLKNTPVWVGPSLSVVVFLSLRYVLPSFMPAKQGGIDSSVMFRPIFLLLSWVCGGAIIVAWVYAEIWKLSNRHRLDRQASLDTIRGLTWRDFELLVSEAYRRRGYSAVVVGSSGGDSGVDIRLNGHGETVLVQCKQWKAYTVGVGPVRELLGVVVSEGADRGILVTSGRFTQEAGAFARQNAQIELVDGPELGELIRGVQAVPRISPTIPTPPAASEQVPTCPRCGRGMVVRTARKGRHAGSPFWGCPKYPACDGMRPLQHAQPN